jgi:hypothetical protein
MPDFDLEYRPLTYWPGEWTTGLARARGSWERWMKQGMADEARPVIGDSPASLAMGEDLPEFEDNEVEIARIEFPSVIGDAVSVRATKSAEGTIQYSVVDEYETQFDVVPAESDGPLSMREVIGLVGATSEGYFGLGVIAAWRATGMEMGQEVQAIASGPQVSSLFYPELHAFFEQEATDWLFEQLLELWETGWSCSCGLEQSEFDEGHFGDGEPAPEHKAGCLTAMALAQRNNTEHS